MKHLTAFTVLLVLISLTGHKAQISPISSINCNFFMTDGLYTCHISLQSVSDNENANIVITGFIHTSGRNDLSVQRVQITTSNLPFIITQLFTRFPNIIDLSITSGGLTRIQPNAFQNALNLRTVSISINNQFREIHPQAFAGASSILEVFLTLNRIDTIHSSSFDGLTSLRTLSLAGNQIVRLPPNIFHSLPALEVIALSDNRLYSIAGNTFANNPNLAQIDLARNLINAIGSSFLDRLRRLNFLSLLVNRCTNSAWVIEGATTISTVRQELNVCFNNAGEVPPVEPEVPGNDLKVFSFELRGSLVIRDENGREIVRL